MLSRRITTWAVLCRVLLLAGCGDKNYEKRGGAWHYDGNPITVVRPDTFTPIQDAFARDATVGYFRGQAIEGSDGPTFERIDKYHARDKRHIYFCDTYRKGRSTTAPSITAWLCWKA